MKDNMGQAYSVRHLLTIMGLKPDTITDRKERQRIREYLVGEDGALEQLQRAGVIGTRNDAGELVDDWRYANDEARDLDVAMRWSDWLKWKILIPAPREVLEFYEGLPEKHGQRIAQSRASEQRSKRARTAAKIRHTQQE
jgi:hypothetical protein